RPPSQNTDNAEHLREAGKRIFIEVWEFGCSDDAFGVFSKDRTGTDIKVGNGSALFNNYLYLWNDIYFIKIEPRQGDVLAEEVTFIGKSIINLMPYKKAALPNIVSYLPQQNLVQESPVFFHKKIILDNIYVSDNFIEKNVFRLSEKTDAVIAEYRLTTNTKSSKLMLVRYSDSETARLAFDDVVKLWRFFGEKESISGTIHIFQNKALHYTSCLLIKNILGITFLSTNKDNAEMLLKLVEEKL
ncbi:MAG: DUF6599 family protein, partial [Planctomycetota bacterium]